MHATKSVTNLASIAGAQIIQEPSCFERPCSILQITLNHLVRRKIMSSIFSFLNFSRNAAQNTTRRHQQLPNRK